MKALGLALICAGLSSGSLYTEVGSVGASVRCGTNATGSDIATASGHCLWTDSPGSGTDWHHEAKADYGSLSVRASHGGMGYLWESFAIAEFSDIVLVAATATAPVQLTYTVLYEGSLAYHAESRVEVTSQWGGSTAVFGSAVWEDSEVVAANPWYESVTQPPYSVLLNHTDSNVYTTNTPFVFAGRVRLVAEDDSAFGHLTARLLGVSATDLNGNNVPTSLQWRASAPGDVVVPEPSTWAMLATAWAMMYLRLRRNT